MEESLNSLLTAKEESDAQRQALLTKLISLREERITKTLQEESALLRLQQQQLKLDELQEHNLQEQAKKVEAKLAIDAADVVLANPERHSAATVERAHAMVEKSVAVLVDNL
jgi:DNA recombination-dependent growth factor C